jgi:hypothetical protein
VAVLGKGRRDILLILNVGAENTTPEDEKHKNAG